MQKIMKQKLKLGRYLSIGIPLIVAIFLSFGNDYIMLRSIRLKQSFSLTELEQQLMISNLCVLFGLCIATFISNMLFRMIIRQELYTPFERLRVGMSHMRQGDYDYRISYVENDPHFEVYDDFNEMATEMRRFAVKANTVDEGRKSLLLSISHDLRSPLTSILAYVQGLLDGLAKTPEKQRSYLDTIKQKSLDIERMVNRLFTFAKLDSDEYHPTLTTVRASRFFRDYTKNVREEYAARNMQLLLEIVSDADIQIDTDLFLNLCQNILDNSVKYNDKPEGIMRIRLKAGKKYMKITFADNGPGVESQKLSRLWDLFFRADDARNNPGQSNGIGLAIVKKTAELFGGSVSAKNGKRDGLQIVIRLPIIQYTQEEG
ncbi:Signal transduction histidine kinase [Lachnospiraceae bacterium XBB1006]|nr:Signal transduction histidine kinase [Lachnospiraceae bacterium XBB1006]